MKIYVSEKENIYLKYNKRCELVILDSKPVIEMTEQELNQPIKTTSLLAYSLEQHEAEIRKPLEDEIIELKEHIRALKSSHDLSHQAYLFAKNEGLDLQNQARLKVITELEKFIDKECFTTTVPCDLGCCELGRVPCLTKHQLRQKLNEMKGEN